MNVCVANPRRSLWRCKLGGGGAGGYVSSGGGYAGVEGGYVAACRKVRLLDRKARIVQIKPHSLVRRYPTRGIEIITGNRPRDPCSSVWKCALCRSRDQHTIPRDRKSTRLNSSHECAPRMPSS